MSLGPNSAGLGRDLIGAGGVLLLVLRDKIGSVGVNSLVTVKDIEKMKSEKGRKKTAL